MMNKRYYEERVDRVLDYISQHLDGDLSLSKLAGVGNFSDFHFHRIFLSITGETLNSHVRRVRLERAAQLMKAAPTRRITDIALEVGFAGLAEFSRAFKAHFGINASAWDRRAPLQKSKICKAPDGLIHYSLEELERFKNDAGLRIEIGKLERCRFFYIRIFDPYGNARLMDVYNSLINWLARRQTELADVVLIGMSQDDPTITPAEKYRYDLGVVFPNGEERGIIAELINSRRRPRKLPSLPTRAECEAYGLSVRDFEAETIAILHCVGDINAVSHAWQYLFRIWLPESGYQPANIRGFEIFVRTPEELGWESFDLYGCLPLTKF